MSAYNYRVFIKDCLALDDLPVANSICLAFNVNRDLLSTATSDFTLLDMPTNIKVGDVLGLADPYGTVIYTGVINSIGDTISCRQALGMFADQWKYRTASSQQTIEGKIKNIIENDFVGSSDPMIADRFPFTVTASSQTAGTLEEKEPNYTVDFEQFLMQMYDQYGIITEVSVPFGAVTPAITIKKATHGAIKIGNNVQAIQNLTPFTEVFETNKLVIYNQEADTIRGTFYTTPQGITTNPNNPLRLPVTKTKFVFDSETDLDEIKQQNLQEQIYNHRISFDLILNRGLYDFYDWELGMPLQIWYNGAYYSTIFTKYSMAKEANADVAAVSITCGKVRNTLTEKLNSYEAPEAQYVGGSTSTDYFDEAALFPTYMSWGSMVDASHWFTDASVWRNGDVIQGQFQFALNTSVASGSTFKPITPNARTEELFTKTYKRIMGYVNSGSYASKTMRGLFDTYNTTQTIELVNNTGGALASGTQIIINFTWVVA